MSAVIRPATKSALTVADFEAPDAAHVPFVPEVAGISAAVCEFMNKEHLRDIANYVVRFGNKFVSEERTLLVLCIL